MTALKTVVFILIVPGLLLGVIPVLGLTGLHWPALPLGPWNWLAVPFWLAGVTALVWCARDFVVRGRGTPVPLEPPRVLVVAGLYRFVRNPMYVAVLLVQVGTTIWYAALAQVVYLLVMFTITHLFVRGYEEPHLRKTFGSAFETYCREVPRWIPRLKTDRR